MKRFLLSFFATAAVIGSLGVASADLRSDMLVSTELSAAGANVTEVTLQENFLVVVQRYIFGLLAVVTVGMLVYNGYNLLMADGNEKDHKKAWMSVLYIAIGLAIVPLSYVAVRIITGLNLQ